MFDEDDVLPVSTTVVIILRAVNIALQVKKRHC